MARKIVNLLSKIIDYVMIILLIILLSYGAYALYDTYNISKKSKLSDEMLHLKPKDDLENISKLREFNDNIFAWVELDNTSIDFPIVQGETNTQYLNEGYYGEFSVSGAIFLDYRNSQNLDEFYSIIYGHHMDNHNMFGDLDLYKDEQFFNDNYTGRIYLEDRTCELEIFACSLVNAYDQYIFSVNKVFLYDKINFIEYIKNVSLYYRNIDLDENSRIIAFSTCASDITSGRFVVFAKVI
jgi:sortase B